MREFVADSHTIATAYWHELDDGRLMCDLCPRKCRLKEGQKGVCFVRERRENRIVMTSYGRSIGFCIDPIEKKPLYHFYPGSAVLSFGTAGCNLKCKFCQNWDISTAREVALRSDTASPETIARAAARLGCRSVAFTYNDPVVFVEYAVDTAIACHELGIKTVAVTAGEICAEPRVEFFRHMDAANVDLKAFSERFYRDLCGGELKAVLETLEYLVNETPVWTEITTLIIPGENDSDEELGQLSAWVAERLGPEIPLHFTAFHPDYKLTDHPPTPPATLARARQLAKSHGLNYVYSGNIREREGSVTRCRACGAELIVRDWHALTAYRLTPEGLCPKCAAALPGHFDLTPGNWGGRCLPVRMSDFA